MRFKNSFNLQKNTMGKTKESTKLKTDQYKYLIWTTTQEAQRD